MTLTCDEARGFAEACGEYANGVPDSFYRGAFRKAAEVINNLCDLLDIPKENEEGKERTSPHTPYREKGKKEKKAATTTARVRVRDGVFAPPSREEVVEFAEAKKIPTMFVDYWLDCMSSNYNPPWYDCVSGKFITAWRRNLICFWAHSDKDKAWFNYKQEVEARSEIKKKQRKYTADEWCLCAERCKHFDAKLCRCRAGGTVPPNLREHAITPEECLRFDMKGE